jgi:hypothetical protein
MANVISTLGYGQFLHKYHTAGFVPLHKKQFAHNRQEIAKRFSLGKRWYYLGP